MQYSHWILSLCSHKSMQYYQGLNIMLQDFAACHMFMKNTRKLHHEKDHLLPILRCLKDIRTDGSNHWGGFQLSTIYLELMDSRCSQCASQPVNFTVWSVCLCGNVSCKVCVSWWILGVHHNLSNLQINNAPLYTWNVRPQFYVEILTPAWILTNFYSLVP